MYKTIKKIKNVTFYLFISIFLYFDGLNSNPNYNPVFDETPKCRIYKIYFSIFWTFKFYIFTFLSRHAVSSAVKNTDTDTQFLARKKLVYGYAIWRIFHNNALNQYYLKKRKMKKKNEK